MPRVELKFTAPCANIRRFSADERLIFFGAVAAANEWL